MIVFLTFLHVYFLFITFSFFLNSMLLVFFEKSFVLVSFWYCIHDRKCFEWNFSILRFYFHAILQSSGDTEGVDYTLFMTIKFRSIFSYYFLSCRKIRYSISCKFLEVSHFHITLDPPLQIWLGSSFHQSIEIFVKKRYLLTLGHDIITLAGSFLSVFLSTLFWCCTV